MMVNRNLFKESESFKNVEKDLAYVVSKIIEDEKLLQLLTLQENRETQFSQKEKKEIVKKCIHIVPKISEIEDDNNWSHISIVFDNFTPNEENPEHRDKILYFDVICHFDTWNMGDFKLRPYQIAGRLDALFNRKSLSNTYSINFLGAEKLTINDDIAGIMLLYGVTYGISADRNDG